MQEEKKEGKKLAHSTKCFSFPKNQRLCDQSIISRIFQEGRFFSFGILKFKFCFHQEQEMKIVISISKRVANSPQRNKIKRLIREALRLSGKLQSTPVYCGIFVNKPLSQKASFHEIQKAIHQFFIFVSP